MESPNIPDDEPFLDPYLAGANRGAYFPSHFLFLHGTEVFQAQVRARETRRRKRTLSPAKIARTIITWLFSFRALSTLLLEIGMVMTEQAGRPPLTSSYPVIAVMDAFVDLIFIIFNVIIMIMIAIAMHLSWYYPASKYWRYFVVAVVFFEGLLLLFLAVDPSVSLFWRITEMAMLAFYLRFFLA